MSHAHHHALGERGVVGRNHHSVFPTVTRLNAASIVTGSYPECHGLMGNSVYFPEISPDTKFSTDNATHLQRIEAATDGRLLTASSLGEILEQAGIKLSVVSAGSSGSAFLLNHKAAGEGLIHTELILPPSNRPRVQESGTGPVVAQSEPCRHRRRPGVGCGGRKLVEIRRPSNRSRREKAKPTGKELIATGPLFRGL